MPKLVVDHRLKCGQKNKVKEWLKYSIRYLHQQVLTSEEPILQHIHFLVAPHKFYIGFRYVKPLTETALDEIEK
jgi:protoheme ferro-lyase